MEKKKKRFRWKTGLLVNIKLKDNFYTIAQILDNDGVIRFYDISNHDGIWKNTNLNEIKPLFIASVIKAEMMDNLVIDRINDKTVIASELVYPEERYYLMNYDGWEQHNHFPYLRGKHTWQDMYLVGAKYIEIKSEYINEGYVSPWEIKKTEILKLKLSVDDPEDRKIIENTEFAKIFTSEAIKQRLLRYFKTGINSSYYKYLYFYDLFRELDISKQREILNDFTAAYILEGIIKQVDKDNPLIAEFPDRYNEENKEEEYLKISIDDEQINLHLDVTVDPVDSIGQEMEEIDKNAYMNGYNWDIFLTYYINKTDPDILKGMHSDPEGDNYYMHYSKPTKKSKERALKLEKTIRNLIEDEKVIYKFLKKESKNINWD